MSRLKILLGTLSLTASLSASAIEVEDSLKAVTGLIEDKAQAVKIQQLAQGTPYVYEPGFIVTEVAGNIAQCKSHAGIFSDYTGEFTYTLKGLEHGDYHTIKCNFYVQVRVTKDPDTVRYPVELGRTSQDARVATNLDGVTCQ